MKYLMLLTLILTGCASSSEVCPQQDQSELCQCYRHEIPRSVCHERPDRFNR